jgi:hypothetical protein
MKMYLTAPEEERLYQCEEIISRGIKTFVDVGKALAEIKNSKLYRLNYPTFEEYCRDKWLLSRSQVYNYISAGEVMENLSTMVDILPLPQNERQARPLTELEPELQIEAVRNVNTEDELTAKTFERSANSLKPLNEKFKETLKDNPELTRSEALEQAKQSITEKDTSEVIEPDADVIPFEEKETRKTFAEEIIEEGYLSNIDDLTSFYKEAENYCQSISDISMDIKTELRFAPLKGNNQSASQLNTTIKNLTNLHQTLEFILKTIQRGYK